MKQKCPNCQQEYHFAENQTGKMFLCLECDNEFLIQDENQQNTSPVEPVLKPLIRTPKIIPRTADETAPPQNVTPPEKRPSLKTISLIGGIVLGICLLTAALFLFSGIGKPKDRQPELSETERNQQFFQEGKTAIDTNNTLALAKLLRRLPVNYADSQGNTLLMYAVAKDKEMCVTSLISNEYNVNQTNLAGETALHAAVRSDNLAMLKTLIRLGGNPDGGESQADSLLAVAAENGSLELLRYLLDHCNLPTEYGNTEISIFRAARKGHLECVKELLRKYHANFLDERGNSLLMAAVQSGKPEMVEFILKKTTNPDQVNQHGKSAFCFALENGNRNIIAMFDLNTMNLSQTAADGTTLPILCAKQKNWTLLPKLLTRDNLNRRDKTGRNVLFYACQGKSGVMVESLLKQGAEHHAELFENTPLYAALNSKNAEAAALLIKQGANCNQKDAGGNTALMLAAGNGDHASVSLLLTKISSSLPEKNAAGKNAVDIAQEKGYLEIAAFLVQQEKMRLIKELLEKTTKLLSDPKIPYADKQSRLNEIEQNSGITPEVKNQINEIRKKFQTEEVIRSTNALKAVMDSAQKDKFFESAIRNLEKGIFINPMASNKKDAEKMLQTLRLAMKDYEEKQKAKRYKQEHLRNMTQYELKAEIRKFIGNWLEDMKMGNPTLHYWENASDASILYNPTDWIIYGVRNDYYSTIQNRVRVNVSSTNKSGYRIQVTWNVEIKRDNETLEWKIKSLTK